MEDLCNQTLDIAHKLGADEAEAFCVDKEVITIRIANSQVAESKGVKGLGLAVRLVKGKAIGTSVAPFADDASIRKTVERALSAAKIRGPAEHWTELPAPAKTTPLHQGCDRSLEELALDDAVSLAIGMLDEARTVSAKITAVSGSLNVVREQVWLMNSHGVSLSDRATYIMATATADAKENGAIVSGTGFAGGRSLKGFDSEGVGSEAANMAVKSLGAKRGEPGEYSVVLEPFAIGDVLSFILSHNFISKEYQDRTSCFYGRLGERIADEGVTVLDDPHRSDGLGSKAFDDEGTPTTVKALIERGVFKNLLYDTFYASKDGKSSTGNAMRLGGPVGRAADPIPFPSPCNIALEPGDFTRDALIRETKKGLLIGRLWYTYPVNPERGDFSCTARSGVFLIENGEVKHPLRMMRIIDNLPRWLTSVGGIGKDVRQVVQWHALPIFTPSVKIDGVKAIPTA